MKIRDLVVLFGILAAGAASTWGATAWAGQPLDPSLDLVRAKVGILISSGAAERMAKSRDRLSAGDMVRVFVHPEKAAYIYVIYSDKQEAVLLNSVAQKTAGSTLVLPSVNESYEIDGTSPFEGFTIIVSPRPLARVSELFAADVFHDQWAALEAELIEKGRMVVTEKSHIPFAIAGNVRGGIKSAPGTGAVKKMRIYTGNTLVVKTYEFAVKK